MSIDPSDEFFSKSSFANMAESVDPYIAKVAAQPDLLHKTNPFIFEAMVGRLLEGLGWLVSTMPGSPTQHEMDYLCIRGDSTLLVQAKRRPLNSPVLKRELAAFVKTIHGFSPDAGGLFITTSSFASNCQEIRNRPNDSGRHIDFWDFLSLLKVIGDHRLPRKEEVRDLITTSNEALIRELAKCPAGLHNLSPRKFEELMADVLKDQGFEVELTPPSKDGGRDILATVPFLGHKLLTLVECKRYSADNPVGLEIVERFMFTIREKDKANLGVIATTSSFTSGARETQKCYPYQLQLHDFDMLCSMFANFGIYKKEPQSGLWTLPTKVEPEAGSLPHIIVP